MLIEQVTVIILVVILTLAMVPAMKAILDGEKLVFGMDFSFALKAVILTGGVIFVASLMIRLLQQIKKRRAQQALRAMLAERPELNEEQFGALFPAEQADTAIRIRAFLMEEFNEYFPVEKLLPQDPPKVFLYGGIDLEGNDFLAVALDWVEILSALEELFSIKLPDISGVQSFSQLVEDVDRIRRPVLSGSEELIFSHSMMGSEGEARDEYNLGRFVGAQCEQFDVALRELIGGRKYSHWMWYIFPQVAGLGYSAMAQRYAIHSKNEATAYLEHPVLGGRLEQCAEALLAHADKNITEIMGSPDDIKLRSSMTLFAALSPDDSVYRKVLDLFFAGNVDAKTVAFLNN